MELFEISGKDFLKPSMVKCSMNEEVGVVKSRNGVFAIVSVPKKSACEGCTMGTCKTGDESMEIEAFNEAGAQEGQQVKVVITAYTYSKGSMIVYGIPAIFLVIGAVIGKEFLSSFFPAVDADMLSAISGFIAFFFSFLGIRIWTGSASKKIESKPVVKEILS